MRRIAKLSLDLAAAPLLFAAFAYWAYGNLSHEVIGLALAAMLIWHIIRKRRWFAALGRGRHDLHRSVGMAMICALAIALLMATITGLMMARDVLPFQLSNGPLTLRLHWASAYWSLVLVGLHIGWHWQRILTALRLNGYPVMLRLMAAGLAVQGFVSAGILGIWPRLVMMPTMAFWDFSGLIWPFYLHLAAVMGLFAVSGYYTGLWVKGCSKPSFITREYKTNLD